MPFLIIATALMSLVSPGRANEQFGAKFECPSADGTFADKISCTKYYVCNNGSNVPKECPNGMKFSTLLKTCDWKENVSCIQYEGYAYRRGENHLPTYPANVPTTPRHFTFPLQNTEFECPSRYGHFADQIHCTKYFICRNGSGVQMECPKGMKFSTLLQRCDFDHVNCIQYTGYAHRPEENELPSYLGEFRTTPKPLKPELPIRLAPSCTKSTCHPPYCRCGSADPPDVMDPDDVPQMIIVSFDGAIADWAVTVSEKTFIDGNHHTRKNPNNCPVRATYFVSHEWTDYSKVQYLANQGHEIAVSGISLELKTNRSVDSWEEEIEGQRRILSKFADIPGTDIVGMRAPYLSIGGDNQFQMLHKNEFVYDSSMPVHEGELPFYPFTLDCRINHDCMIRPCPSNSFPGIWEMPINTWSDLSGSKCQQVEQCTDAQNYQEMYEVLISNFEHHYTTNRAPFNILLSQSWYAKEMNQQAFGMFLDTVLNKTDQARYQDVYFVTMSQAIQWMKKPTTRKSIEAFEPWQCTDLSNTPPCPDPNMCTPWFEKNKETRPFKTCHECPKNYPWVGNQEGH